MHVMAIRYWPEINKRHFIVQKIKSFSPQRRREKHFLIVNRAAGAVNKKLAFPLRLCASAVNLLFLRSLPGRKCSVRTIY